MKRKGKKGMWVLIVLGVLAAAMGIGMLATAPGRRELKAMAFPEATFGPLQSGVYTGSYKGAADSMRNTRVEVTVSEGRVADIRVLEGATVRDGKAFEVRKGQTIDDLSQRVIASQSLGVDVLSGATLTSNAHLKAVENALEQAGKR